MRTRFALATFCVCIGCAGPYRTVVLDRPPIDAWSPAPARSARICALRPSWVGGAVPMLVHDGGRLVAALGADSYHCWLAAPGVHHLTVQPYSPHLHRGPTPTAIELPPGGRAYLAVSTDLGDELDIEWLDETEALERIERCSWEQLVSAPPGERLR